VQYTASNLDNDEFLDFRPTNLDITLEIVWSGKITDVKTIIGLLWFYNTISDLI